MIRTLTAAVLVLALPGAMSAPASAGPAWWLLNDDDPTLFKSPKLKYAKSTRIKPLVRLDWCYAPGRHCGKPAADAFCRKFGYGGAQYWKFAPDVGPTQFIATGQLCASKSCDGFEAIKCLQKHTPALREGRSNAPTAKAVPGAVPPLSPVMERGVDRPGGDIHGFPLAQAKPELCRQACTRNARCRAWTWVRPGVRGARSHCFLKGSIPPPRKDPCCVSGVK